MRCHHSSTNTDYLLSFTCEPGHARHLDCSLRESDPVAFFSFTALSSARLVIDGDWRYPSIERARLLSADPLLTRTRGQVFLRKANAEKVDLV